MNTMRHFLDLPEMEKHSFSGVGNDMRFTGSWMQGYRSSMEDAHAALPALRSPYGSYSYFGMFDGHEGDTVAKYCSSHLADHVMQTNEFLQLQNEQLPKEAKRALIKQGLINGFLSLDETLRKVPEFQSGANRAGSTAVCALITPDTIYFANCGDSRGIIVSKERVTVATVDHKPINPTERERIQKAGGSVFLQRVNGALGVSRALGDFEYKNVPDKGVCEQLVSPEPDVIVWERTHEDEFIVLACDGVWDVMDNDEICQFVRNELLGTDNLEVICQRIVDTCLNKGSRDNISVILIVFPGAPCCATDTGQKEESLCHNSLTTKDVESAQQVPNYKSSNIVDRSTLADVVGLSENNTDTSQKLIAG